MKNKILLSLSAFFILNVGILSTSYVLASGCSDPVVISGAKNKFLSMSGCKQKAGHTCVIVRCPIAIK